MFGPHITLLTAGILGVIYTALSIHVSMQRGASKVSIGDGSTTAGAEKLLVAIRMHGNFSEYVPLALILLGGIEFAGAAPWLVTIFAVVLVAGRISHALGMRQPNNTSLRAAGSLLTYVTILGTSLTALALAL
jgi:uncharacterized membrane protein YecN with MAPEG domain